jgi:hypothetical protein
MISFVCALISIVLWVFMMFSIGRYWRAAKKFDSFRSKRATILDDARVRVKYALDVADNAKARADSAEKDSRENQNKADVAAKDNESCRHITGEHAATIRRLNKRLGTDVLIKHNPQRFRECIDTLAGNLLSVLFDAEYSITAPNDSANVKNKNIAELLSGMEAADRIRVVAAHAWELNFGNEPARDSKHTNATIRTILETPVNNAQDVIDKVYGLGVLLRALRARYQDHPDAFSAEEH